MRFKRPIDLEETAPSRTLVAKERKLQLEQTGAIRCGRCPYHRRENATFRTLRSDVRKEGRRVRRAARRLAARLREAVGL
jgi:hypothetical protein